MAAACYPELPDSYRSMPLRALRVTSRMKLSGFLDIEGSLVVCGDVDVVNDYNGLAELAEFTYQNIMNMKRQKSPTTELLDQWTGRGATVGMLWQFLVTMERIDVLSDCQKCILKDCEVYDEHEALAMDAHMYNIEQDPTVTTTEMHKDETKFATRDDVRTGRRTKYDAFLCYTQEDDEDRKFVLEIICTLEKERGLKLFVPGRDDLPGSAEHTITAYLIEKRCRRIVILISRKFLQSAACDFQIKFAQALAPGARSKKLIPVIRQKNTNIPRILRFLAVCDFSKSDMTEWVWDRLYTAIIAPIDKETYFDADDPSNPFDSEESLKYIAYPSHQQMEEHEDQSTYSALPMETGATGSLSADSSCRRSEPMEHGKNPSEQSTSVPQPHSQSACESMSAKNWKGKPTTCSEPSTAMQSKSEAPMGGNIASKRI